MRTICLYAQPAGANVIVWAQRALPWMQGLSQYGNGFLSKFELAQCPSPLLDEITLVDTPGVLSGEKQRIERTYSFLDVCGWFAARCDLILLLFDPHKLDISDEMKQVGGLPSLICLCSQACAQQQSCSCHYTAARELQSQEVTEHPPLPVLRWQVQAHHC